MTFEAAWTAAEPWLDAALAHAGRTHGLSDVRRMVLAGEAQLWTGPASAAVSVVQRDPGERRLLIWLAGGDLGELKDQLLPAMEAFGRTQGCRRMLVIGRPGWERALKPQGYAPIARLIAKDL